MKAFLGWPVKFKAPYHDLDLHMTLKYLGKIEDSQGTAAEVADRLKGLSTELLIDSGVSWRPLVWNRSTRVLALDGLAPSLPLVWQAVEFMTVDIYPRWQPHITVPAKAWREIARTCCRAPELIEAVGPLSLFVKRGGQDYKIVHEYGRCAGCGDRMCQGECY